MAIYGDTNETRDNNNQLIDLHEHGASSTINPILLTFATLTQPVIGLAE